MLCGPNGYLLLRSFRTVLVTGSPNGYLDLFWWHKAVLGTYVDLKLPATDGLVCEDLGEWDGEAFTEEALTVLTVDICSCNVHVMTQSQHGVSGHITTGPGWQLTINTPVVNRQVDTYIREFLNVDQLGQKATWGFKRLSIFNRPNTEGGGRQLSWNDSEGRGKKRDSIVWNILTYYTVIGRHSQSVLNIVHQHNGFSCFCGVFGRCGAPARLSSMTQFHIVDPEYCVIMRHDCMLVLLIQAWEVVVYEQSVL